jgi:cystathionine beta-lyase/cystathionine gamma-synthase
VDILGQHGKLHKHTFDIQGRSGHVLEAISSKLAAMKSGPTKALTLIQLEYPTNPDMKDCDLAAVQPALESYAQATGSGVVLLLDTTFSPISQSAAHFSEAQAVVVFNSLSKSVSGGRTTGGSLVANNNPLAQQVLARAHAHLALLDTASKSCQLAVLNSRNGKVEERIRAAHDNAALAAAYIEACVARLSGQEMKVNFVTEAQIAKNVVPATFSFNLPVPAHLAEDTKALADLAQDLVDRLVEEYPTAVKPCVSFGQENTLVYVTVPATSTQGVISEADKAKQSVGGVQLVRFSFPPSMDLDAFNQAIDRALVRLYTAPAQ